MQSYDVRVWDLRKRTRTGRPTRFEVRWVVDTQEHSRSFEFKAQADAFRSSLIAAAKTGEPFDVDTGQPVGATRGTGPTCYEIAQQMMAAKWVNSAAKSRVTEVDNLAHVLCALVPTNRTAPEGVTFRPAGHTRPEKCRAETDGNRRTAMAQAGIFASW